VEDVLAERLLRLGVPLISGAPIGHALRNEPVVLGGRARVEAVLGGASRLELGDA
jgi:muramoyltetrapeptide carboxypeptidase